MSDTAPIFDAITAGDQDKFRELLEQNPDWADAVDENENGILVRAAVANQEEMVLALLEARGEDPVFASTIRGDRDAVMAQCDEDASRVKNESKDGFTALHFAAFFSQDRTLDVLVEYGADIEAVTSHPSKMMPIHCAALSGKMEAIDSLLNRGADPDALRADGWTALMIAAAHGYERPLLTILHHNCDVDVESSDGKTAVDLARENGHDRLAEIIPG